MFSDGKYCPGDAIMIAKLPDKRFYVIYFEEHPPPGPVQPIEELATLRLRSKMHHTAGADTLEEARQQVDELVTASEYTGPKLWEGEPIELDEPSCNITFPNWLKKK